MAAELTCGYIEPYLNRLLEKPPLKTREGRRWYQSAGCSSLAWRIMQSLKTLQRPVPVVCYSKDHRSGVTIWYTGYSIFATDEAAYDDSMIGSTNTWWPTAYNDKASMNHAMHTTPWL